MKKLLSLAAIVIGLNAYQISIKSGWQLKGALEDINVTDVFNKPEIVSVWTYDGETNTWRAYLPNMNIDLSNYNNIEPLNVIHQGEGFWVNANSNLLIETGGINTGGGSGVYNFITENNLIDTPTTFSLSDVAGKTFKVFVEDDFIEVTFDSNGIANLTIDGENYEVRLENGIIKAYENDVLISKYKKVKADNNGIIVFGTDLDLEYNNTFSYLEPWLTTISPVDMSTLNYPFTVYEADYDYVSKITFESNKILVEDEELNSTIENGKITVKKIEDHETEIYQAQYIGEVDRYKILRVDVYWEYWEIDNNLVGVTFNDNQTVTNIVNAINSDENLDVNITLNQIIDETNMSVTICDDDGCYSGVITLDSSDGNITISANASFVTIHSENPIIAESNNSN